MTVSSSGAFYMVQLAPETTHGRVKFGWTRDLIARLTTHRCAAPTARLVKAWPCIRARERQAIATLARSGCRRVSSEVFDVEDLVELVQRGDNFFGGNPTSATTLELLIPRGPEALPEYLTTRETADRLKVTEGTVRRWVRAGMIRGNRLSDRAGYRIPRSEIERVLREGFREEPL